MTANGSTGMPGRLGYGYLYYRNALISAEFLLDEPPDEQLEMM
jgi:hypothetical protein